MKRAPSIEARLREAGRAMSCVLFNLEQIGRALTADERKSMKESQIAWDGAMSDWIARRKARLSAQRSAHRAGKRREGK